MSTNGERARIARLMPILPYIALWSVLALAGLASAGVASRPRLRASVNVLAVVVAGGLWLWARPQPSGGPSVTPFLGYAWSLTSAGWQLTGMVLLVCLSISLWSWARGLTGIDVISPGDTSLPSLWLSLSLLPFLWAADPLTSATMLAFFVVTCALLLWQSGGRVAGERRSRGHLATFLLAPLLLVWFADAIAIIGVAGPIWVELAGSAVLLAAAVLMDVWPFAGWRDAVWHGAPGTTLALSSLPIVAGASILLPVAQQLEDGSLHLALAVILGLLSVLMGLRLAGQMVALRAAGAAGLAGALSGIVLLTAVFVSEAALLAATRVAVFAPLVLALIAVQRASAVQEARDPAAVMRQPWVDRTHTGLIAIVWLAVLGLPLTAGLTSIGGLYDAWQPGAPYLLTAILVLLLVVWSAVMSQTVWRLLRLSGQAQAVIIDRPTLLGLVLLIVPTIGLVQLNLMALPSLSVVAWAAIMIPLIAGPLLARLLDGRMDWMTWTAAGALPTERLEPLKTGAQRGWTFMGDAVAEAIATLEGPSGLLWVLLIVALLVFSG